MDIKQFYVEKGQENSKPIILMHGNGEDHEFFVNQIDVLAENGYHVFALDTRAHGKTPRGEKPLTVRQLSEDLKDFMDEKGLEKVDIFGFSDGANIAMIFAQDYPERVGKMILNGGNLDKHGMTDKIKGAIQRHYDKACEDADKDEKAHAKMELFGLMINDPNIDPEDLTNIEHECLVIAGTDDMIKEEHTKLIAEKLPNSRLEIIEGDHFVAKKDPERFNPIMLDFLKG